MKTLLLLAISVSCFGQVDFSSVVIIPSTSATTGLVTAAGTVVYEDTEATPKTVTVEAPSTVTTSYAIKWPVVQAAGAMCNDGSGNMSFGSCGACPTCMVTTGGQTVTGADTWNANLIFGNGDYLWFNNQWAIDSDATNKLSFRDSSSTLRAYLDASGVPSVGGSGVDFVLPSVWIQNTSANSPAAIIAGLFGQSADILDVDNSSLTKELWVDSSGNTHIANCVAGCGSTYTGTPPIGVSGTAISCATCLVTVGGQTITGSDTWNANQTLGNGDYLWFNNQWAIDSDASNELEFRDSSSTLIAYLDARGTPSVGGSGIDFVLPSVYIENTSANSPSIFVNTVGSQTADVADIELSGTKELWLDDSGYTHFNLATFAGGNVVTNGVFAVGPFGGPYSFGVTKTCTALPTVVGGIITSC